MSAAHTCMPECLEQASSPALDIGERSLPASPARSARRTLQDSALGRVLHGLWSYLRQESGSRLLQRKQRRLRVSETISLGEKRTVSILEVDGQSFLLASSGAGVELLATLAPCPKQVPFERVLRASLQEGNER